MNYSMSGWRHLREAVYLSPFRRRDSTLLWCTSGTLLIPYCVHWHLVSPLLFMWNLTSCQLTKVCSQQSIQTEQWQECIIRKKPLFTVTGRSNAASRVNAFIWNHYPKNTTQLNKCFLISKCMKLWNIYTMSAEYLKQKGKMVLLHRFRGNCCIPELQ
jgi:hypothetical protein